MQKKFFFSKYFICGNILFLSILSSLTMINCSRKEHTKINKPRGNKNALILKIKYDEIKPIKASMIFSELEYVKLSEPDNIPLSSIDKIIVKGDYIFILDQEKSYAIFIYDLEGNFINCINKKGNGPGEYQFPNDFLVDIESNTIEILDSSKARILYYTITGEFIKVLKLNFKAFKFMKINNKDSYLFFTTKSSNTHYGTNLPCKLFKYSKNIGTIECLLDSTNDSKPFFVERNVFADDEAGNIIFSHTFNDTIYMYRNDTLNNYLIFDFGNEKFSETFFKRKFSNGLERIIAFNKTKDAFHEPNLFMNNNFLYTKFRYNKYTEVFFKKKNKNLIITDQIINDIDFGVSEFTFIGFSNNKLIATIDAYRIIDRYNKINRSSRYKKINNKNLVRFKEFAKKLNINDPQILIFCKLKNIM